MPSAVYLGTDLTSRTLSKPCELALSSPHPQGHLFLEPDPVHSFPGKSSIILRISPRPPAPGLHPVGHQASFALLVGREHGVGGIPGPWLVFSPLASLVFTYNPDPTALTRPHPILQPLPL